MLSVVKGRGSALLTGRTMYVNAMGNSRIAGYIFLPVMHVRLVFIGVIFLQYYSGEVFMRL